jgi:hypothetical protein
MVIGAEGPGPSGSTSNRLKPGEAAAIDRRLRIMELRLELLIAALFLSRSNGIDPQSALRSANALIAETLEREARY